MSPSEVVLVEWGIVLLLLLPLSQFVWAFLPKRGLTFPQNVWCLRTHPNSIPLFITVFVTTWVIIGHGLLFKLDVGYSYQLSSCLLTILLNVYGAICGYYEKCSFIRVRTALTTRIGETPGLITAMVTQPVIRNRLLYLEVVDIYLVDELSLTELHIPMDKYPIEKRLLTSPM